MGWKQNFFVPKHPEKYLGDANNIFYRSSWEEDAFRFCDMNPNVTAWASEEIVIPYTAPDPKSPTGMKKRKYYPDLYIEYINEKGEEKKILVEIKPNKQTKKSRARDSLRKQHENWQYMINECKWEAARNWCRQKGVEFQIWTETNQYR